MLFNSVHFFLFAPIVVFLFYRIGERARRWWLLAASLYFYGSFRFPYLFLLLFSIFITYFAATGIAKTADLSRRRLYLWLAVLGNLSILYFFKYIDYSFRIWNLVFQLEPCDLFYLNTLGVILPLGISFFTLQSIAYAVDVYRGQIDHRYGLMDFSLFLTFFPQLVAGPIMRASDIIAQFAEKKKFSIENFRYGIGLITLGLFKKTVVGDPAGAVVDAVFADPLHYSWWANCLGVFFFAVQIYGDFSGYSDVAIGIGRILGFRIPVNFLRPFLAQSFTDLWRRWHISLSSWLRDYIYFPLGGSRVSPFRFHVNLAITWILTGLWHGADWTFVFWGSSQALFLALEKFFFSFPRFKAVFGALPSGVRILYSFLLFCFGIFFFRAQPVGGMESLTVAFEMIRHTFTFADGAPVSVPSSLPALVVLLFAIEWFAESRKEPFALLERRPFLLYTLSSIVLVYCFILYSVTVNPQFIYFQF